MTFPFNTSLRKSSLIATATATLFLGGISLANSSGTTEVEFEKEQIASIADLQNDYAEKIRGTIDTWYDRDISLYSTGHVCKTTSVAGSTDTSYRGHAYITPKIHTLSQLMVNLAALHPHLDTTYRAKSIVVLKKIYYWLYRQIDWKNQLVADDYGRCFKGLPRVYSHLTTAFAVQGLLALKNLLPSTDKDFARLNTSIETLSKSQLVETDKWMTPLDQPPLQYSANFMATNLSTLFALNDVNKKNEYVIRNLGHRLKSDYTWIRSSFVNYSTEISCGAELLYGGWNHNTLENTANLFGISPTCSYFNQTDKSNIASAIRSYYLQKTSYHTIITVGLMDLLKLLKQRQQCDLIKFGSKGTCNEIQSILKGASTWLYFMISENGKIPSAYQSYPIDEFGYFNDASGTAIGSANLIKLLKVIKTSETSNNPAMRFTFLDRPAKHLLFSTMKDKIKLAIAYSLKNTSSEMLASLQDAPFVLQELFPE